MIKPAFIPLDTTCVYRVEFYRLREVFEAPPRRLGRHMEERETVYPFLDCSGKHTMSLYSLSRELCRYHDALRRGAVILEAQANCAFYTLFMNHGENTDFLAANFMIGWYLADDDAGIGRLADKWHDFLFSDTDTAVWTCVAFIRNRWGLEPYLSHEAVSTYLDCYYRFVSLLRIHGVRLHTSRNPIG
jgi:hypothetical protein